MEEKGKPRNLAGNRSPLTQTLLVELYRLTKLAYTELGKH
jgi:hypothetical protein